ncbi:MAG: sigma-70 family RNA polymerase sigma factor [Deltaproteobacteria bacterium]|nr:sigma-70 family RNA polymerase sigma factor [Deltaproteobacteria bacterium]
MHTRTDRASQEPVVDAPQEARALVRQLYAGLDQISVSLRVAWQLRHIEGYSLSEVAHHTGCSVSTAKRRISAAQEQLSRLLAIEGKKP